ncbi:MAG: response regulator SirA, partial [Gemmatimonadota bacterium]
ARKVMAFIDEEARVASEKLAESRGVFPAWEESIWGPDETAARVDGNRVRPVRRLRNSNITTVAPTGTISIFADCSGGIEPLFAVAFMRNQAGSLMPDVNKDFVRIAKEQGWYSEGLMERIAAEGHIYFDEVPADVQRVFVTSHDVTPAWHIRMQAAFQEHTDSAISKTCNFSESATEDDVREIYLQAHALKCKGVTVYRDGTRPAQVLSTGKTGKKEETARKTADLEAALADAREENHRLVLEMEETEKALRELEIKNQRRLHKRTRPQALHGTTRKMRSPLGDLYVTVNEDEDGHPFEVFATLGKAGGAAMAHAEAIGRLISLALRSGIPMDDVVNQLRGISCDRAVGIGPNKVLSMPDAIGQVLQLHMQEKEGIQEELGLGGAAPRSAPAAIRTDTPDTGRADVGRGPDAEQRSLDYYDPGDAFIGTCPECASDLMFAEGCAKCPSCGYSECG